MTRSVVKFLCVASWGLQSQGCSKESSVKYELRCPHNTVVPNWQPQNAIDNLMASLRAGLAFSLSTTTTSSSSHQRLSSIPHMSSGLLAYIMRVVKKMTYVSFLYHRDSLLHHWENQRTHLITGRETDMKLCSSPSCGIYETLAGISVCWQNRKAFFLLELWNHSMWRQLEDSLLLEENWRADLWLKVISIHCKNQNGCLKFDTLGQLPPLCLKHLAGKSRGNNYFFPEEGGNKSFIEDLLHDIHFMSLNASSNIMI